MSMSQADWADAWDIYNGCVGSGGDSAHCEMAAQNTFPDFEVNSGSGGGFGGAMSDFWSNPNNWVNVTQGITGIVGDIIGFANGQPVYSTTAPPTGQQQDNTMMWVIGGVALLLFIILLIVVFRK